jgi:nitroimidazol reductase NimA-like FMN-containing flavoprotein (pyridoxamine 5'-phosphate oxidase superfamily)
MYEATQATTPSRHAERATHDEHMIHSILDEALIGHLAFADDGLPQILPLLFVRVGNSVYLHGSTGAHFARMAARRGPLAVSFEATLVDALVLARSAFSHSANYRCVIAHGMASIVQDPAHKEAVLAALMDKLVPGRNSDARAPRPDELRKTALLELPLTEVGAKVRTGGPLDDESDLGLGVWAGLRPIVSHWGTPVPADDLEPTVPLPDYLGDDGRCVGAGVGAGVPTTSALSL